MLEFNLGSYPVRISFTFFFLGIIFASERLGAIGLVLVLAAALVSVLIHELGHAYTVGAFGGRVESVTLHGFGGVTMWTDPAGTVTGWKRAAVAAAGSAVQIALAVGVWVLAWRGVLGPTAKFFMDKPWSIHAIFWFADIGEWPYVFLAAFVWIGFVWGIFNWLPIGGLDGYHIFQEGFIGVLGPGGARHAAITSVLIGGAAAYIAAQRGFQIMAIFIVFLALQPLFQRR